MDGIAAIAEGRYRRMGRPIDENLVIDVVMYECGEWVGLAKEIVKQIITLPTAQSKQTDCEYCHEDSEGYVKPIEKNLHVWLVRQGRTMKLRACFKGGYSECDISYCPMCGRRLNHG